jgi:hypothetical protein
MGEMSDQRRSRRLSWHHRRARSPSLSSTRRAISARTRPIPPCNMQATTSPVRTAISMPGFSPSPRPDDGRRRRHYPHRAHQWLHAAKLERQGLADESREMAALIAYFRYIGKGTPEGVRLAGMGLKPIASPPQPPDDVSQGRRAGRAVQERRGLRHTAALGRGELQCGRRHREDRLRGVLHSRQHAVRRDLTVQQAWDVAAYMISKAHPPAPPETSPELP